MERLTNKLVWFDKEFMRIEVNHSVQAWVWMEDNYVVTPQVRTALKDQINQQNQSG